MKHCDPEVTEARWRSSIEASLGAIADVQRNGASAVTSTLRVELQSGACVFLKFEERDAPSGIVAQESASLRALAETATVRVPAILAEGDGWIALEWLVVQPGDAERSDSWRALGLSIAALHGTRAADYGWRSDNFIGSVPQKNARIASWPEFWNEYRLRPLIEKASGSLQRSDLERLNALSRDIPALLEGTDADGPSLLHGDLWSGNAMLLADGSAAVVDPSCYYGHRETDLAMAALFGGFAPAFFESYAESYPLLPGFERRRPVYQLYYLLAHVVMFGAGYRDSVLRAAGAAGY